MDARRIKDWQQVVRKHTVEGRDQTVLVWAGHWSLASSSHPQHREAAPPRRAKPRKHRPGCQMQREALRGRVQCGKESPEDGRLELSQPIFCKS